MTATQRQPVLHRYWYGRPGYGESGSLPYRWIVLSENLEGRVVRFEDVDGRPAYRATLHWRDTGRALPGWTYVADRRRDCVRELWGAPMAYLGEERGA